METVQIGSMSTTDCIQQVSKNAQRLYDLTSGTEIFSLFFAKIDIFVNSTRVPIAGIGYRDYRFMLELSEKYFNLDEDEQVYVLGHELIHCMYKHPIVYAEKCSDIVFQISADLFINQILNSLLKIAPLQGSIQIEDFIKQGILQESDRNKSIQYYYDILKEYADKLNKEHQDMSSLWGDFKDLQESEKILVENGIDNAIKKIGNISGILRELIDTIRKPSKIDYKQIFDRFVSSSMYTNQLYTSSRYNKRYPGFPGATVKNILSFMVVIDTSGSITQKDLKVSFNQIDKFRKLKYNIDIVESDCSIGNTYPYTGVIPTKISGGGGTSFTPAIEHFNKHSGKYGCIVYLTDGHADIPKVIPTKPILWLLTETGKTVDNFRKEGFKGLMLKLTEND